MVSRQSPQEYFGVSIDEDAYKEERKMVIDENTWILVGIIVVGIVACVACVAIASMKGK